MRMAFDEARQKGPFGEICIELKRAPSGLPIGDIGPRADGQNMPVFYRQMRGMGLMGVHRADGFGLINGAHETLPFSICHSLTLPRRVTRPKRAKCKLESGA